MKGEIVSRERRGELLLQCRRFRAKWVMAASWEDVGTRRELQRGAGSGQKVPADAEIPVTESIKTVLDYLSFVSDDGDFLDVQSLAMSLPESGGPSLAQEDGEDSDQDDELDDSEDENIVVSMRANGEGVKGNNYSQMSILKEINAATSKPEESLESKSGNEEEAQIDNTKAEEKRGSDSGFDGTSGIPFVDFLKLLKRQIPEVLSIVKSMQSFVARVGVEAVDANIKFDSERTQEDRHKSWAREIAKFVLEIQAQMKMCSPWVEEAEDDWKQTCAFVEKFMHLKLYPTLFGRDSNVEAQDVAFYQRLQALDFLTPEHLDIKSLKTRSVGNEKAEGEANEWESFFSVPVSRLRDLEACRTPVDMIACLKTVTVSIAAALKAALGDGGDPGADELLPMMILALVRVKPKKMHSVISYVNNYTSELKMDSESGYLITQLMSAVQFLSELDASRITIAAQDFEEKMLRCQEDAKAEVSARFSLRRDKLYSATAKDGTSRKTAGWDEREKDSQVIFSSQAEEEAFVASLLDCEQDTAMLNVMHRFTRKAPRAGRRENRELTE